MARKHPVGHDYVIATRWSGCDHVIPLTSDQYQAAWNARELLLTALALEESHDIFILNYLAFERAVFSAKITTVLDRSQQRHEIEDMRRELDRHLVNLLASGEMFLAHTKGFLTSVPRRGYAVDLNEVDSRRQALEAELPTLAAMRWLRNATLHQTLPISSWSYGGSWSDRSDATGPKRLHNFTIVLDIELLVGIRDIPEHLREAIGLKADVKGRISWRDLIREYTEGVSRLNVVLRDAISSAEIAARSLLDEHLECYRAPFGGEQPLSVEAVLRAPDGAWIESFSLDFDYAKRISTLRQKNSALVNLRRVEILD